MSGLRFLACEQCGTVHAEPVVPPRCGSCEGSPLVDITTRLGREPYFEPG